MKKVFILAAVAAIALTSCQREKDINGGINTTKDDMVFALQGAATRAADSFSPVKQGEYISLGEISGYEMFLEETITDLNFAAETRGTPVYTENVGYLYKDMLGVYTDGAGGVDASFARLEAQMGDEGWLYQHRYAQDIWPDEETEIQFYLRMPTDMTSHGVNSLQNASGVTTVEYSSPGTATEQEDIIFGGIKMDHKTYMGHYSSKGGAPVTLYHALTGIKFAIANTTAELANLQITKISFKGLTNNGKFTFDTATHQFDWLEVDADEDYIMSQTYTSQDFVTYDATTHASNNFAPSFFNGGTKQNLNDDQATKTFWLIPQATTGSEGTLRIEYTANEVPAYIEIPVANLTTSDWQAGQIRTYTFRVNEVNIQIEDTVAPEKEDNVQLVDKDGNVIRDKSGNPYLYTAYKGTKDNVKITNTSNTDVFIRAALIGQWLDSEGDPVFGFTDYTAGKVELVESWYQDQFITMPGKTAPSRTHGTFTGLVGYDPDYEGDWVLGNDGYYYYKNSVAPGQSIPNTENDDPLFESYEVNKNPAVLVAGKVEEVYFVLEISTQAIAAKKLDGTLYNWQDAWERALGTKPTVKQ